MKQVFSKFLLLSLSTYLLCAFLGFPWYTLVFLTLLVGLFGPESAFSKVLTGFLSGLILWGGLALWIHLENGGVLSEMVSQIIIKKDQPYLMVLITALVGGVTGGLGSLVGTHLGAVLFPKRG